MQKITTFFWFQDGAEEAINNYVSIFSGSPNKKAESKVVSIQRYPDNIPNPPWGEGMNGKIITAVFELEGQRFMGLDGGPTFKPTGAMSLLVECENQEEIDYFWDKLTAGGDPKAQQCGWLMDKYGFSWQIVPDMDKWLNGSDKEGAKRAMEAMLEMKKIDISELEKAYNG